jgi:ubiquinone/menaquinone biosynthesis C-methylase UbiE
MSTLVLDGGRAGNPLRGRINSWFFDALDDHMHAMLGAAKEALFADLPDTVVELGPGTGANLRYLRPGTKLVAIEPNPFMHERLVRRAAEHDIALDLRVQGAELLPFADASVDAVISTLVLCTVEDVDAVLAEVKRVLRPGGTFRCIEHVAAPGPGFVHHVQRLVAGPWRWFFEGCHTHRPLAEAMEAAGFSEIDLRRVDSPTLFVPVRPQIHVRATR